MNPSERIRAALSRPTGSHPALDSPPDAPPADVETTLSLVTAPDQARVATPKFEDPPPALAKREKPKPSIAIDEAPTPVAPVARPKEPKAEAKKPTNLKPIIAAVLVLGAGAGAFFTRNLWMPARSEPAAANARPLQMDVESAGPGVIRVVWKPDSVPVTQAREGRLVISEGSDQPRAVALTAAQLKTGHFDYSSGADRFDFRLEVVGPSGAVSAESVRARLPKPAETQTASQPVQAPPEQQPVKDKNADKLEVKKEQLKNEQAKNEQPADPPQPKPIPRPFTPPPEQTVKPAEDIRTVVLDAPPTNVPVGTMFKPVTGLPDKMPNLPAPTPTAPSASTSAQRKPAPVGGNLLEPRLVKKVSPVYPSLAKSLRVEGAVRFTATIRKDGSVTNVQLISGHRMLVQAATEAVKQWVYRPAVLNGSPVETTTQIDVKFTLNE